VPSLPTSSVERSAQASTVKPTDIAIAGIQGGAYAVRTDAPQNGQVDSSTRM
jgi:hypothetical protein